MPLCFSLKGNSRARTHKHARPDATWAVSGELLDALILKLLMAVINHMMLNHFGDSGGGSGRRGNKRRDEIEEGGWSESEKGKVNSR